MRLGSGSWLQGDILQRQAEYWKAALSGAPALLELPADRPRPPQQDFAGALVKVALDAGLTQRLKALSQRHGVTLFMTLLAAWAALLTRLSGQHEVVIGSATANRTRTEIEPLIGFFVNTLALRIDVSGAPTASELLARVKAQALSAQEHQDIPFEQVVEAVQPPRSLAHSPLFQVMFAWQNAPQNDFELPGLRVSPIVPPHVTAMFDLLLSLGEQGEEIVGGLEYATALFDRETIERYLGYWHNLLEAMAADDARPIDRLPLLGRRRAPSAAGGMERHGCGVSAGAMRPPAVRSASRQERPRPSRSNTTSSSSHTANSMPAPTGWPTIS